MENVVFNTFMVALWDNAEVGGGPRPLGTVATTRGKPAMLSDLVLEEFRGAVEWKMWFSTHLWWLCGTMPRWEEARPPQPSYPLLVASQPCYQIWYLKSFEGQWNGKCGFQHIYGGFVGQCRGGRRTAPARHCSHHSWQASHAIRSGT